MKLSAIASFETVKASEGRSIGGGDAGGGAGAGGEGGGGGSSSRTSTSLITPGTGSAALAGSSMRKPANIISAICRMATAAKISGFILVISHHKADKRVLKVLENIQHLVYVFKRGVAIGDNMHAGIRGSLVGFRNAAFNNV